MRLPNDATLLIGDDADPRLELVWREQQLPVARVDFPLDRLEAVLESVGATTVVACGENAAVLAAAAAGLGFRSFCVGQPANSAGLVCVSAAQAIEGALGARARERWKAARQAN